MKMTRFTIVGISLIAINCMLAGVSSAKIDLETIVGMWLFDEGTGKVAKDSSENGNDGELMGDPKWVEGQFGKALELDGDDWVDMGDAEILKPVPNVSFVVWYYWETGNYVLSTGGQTSSTGIAITHNPDDGTIWFGVSTGKKSAITGYIAGPKKEVWHHLAGSYDDSELIAYVDGKEYATVAASSNPLDNAWPSLHIGKPNNTDAYHLQGIVDEVAIFNVALSDGDISSIMKKGLEGAAAVSSAGKLATIWGQLKSDW